MIKKVLQVEEILFLLVGKGPYQEYFQENFSKKVVRTEGHVPYTEIHRYYKAADLYLHPSPYEGIPLVILEALQCGLPVIARDAGDINFVTPVTVKSKGEMVNAILKENWKRKWSHRKYFSRTYQKYRLHQLIEACT